MRIIGFARHVKMKTRNRRLYTIAGDPPSSSHVCWRPSGLIRKPQLAPRVRCQTIIGGLSTTSCSAKFTHSVHAFTSQDFAQDDRGFFGGKRGFGANASCPRRKGDWASLDLFMWWRSAVLPRCLAGGSRRFCWRSSARRGWRRKCVERPGNCTRERARAFLRV